jgi:hypothetical protein
MTTKSREFSVQESLAWFGELERSGFELEAHPPGLRAMAVPADTTTKADGTKSVWLDGGAGITFVDGLSSITQQDLLDSFEYAQRYANTRIHTKYGLTDPKNQNADTKFTHAQEWYAEMNDALSHLHYIAQAWDFSSVHLGGDTVTVDKVVLDILKAYLGDASAAMAAVQESIQILKSLGKEDQRMTLWNSHSKSQGRGSFQMAAAQQESASDPVSLKTGAFQFNSKQTTTDCFFFFHFSTTRTEFSKAAQNLVFNQQRYVANREQVADAIAASTNEWLAKAGELE